MECSEGVIPVYMVGLISFQFMMFFLLALKSTSSNLALTERTRPEIKFSKSDIDKFDSPKFKDILKNLPEVAEEVYQECQSDPESPEVPEIFYEMQSNNICRFHLLVTQFLNTSISRAKKAVLLYLNQLFYVAFIGFCLFVTENTQVEIQENYRDIQKTAAIVGTAMLTALVLDSFNQCTLWKGETNLCVNAIAWVLVVAQIFVCLAGTIVVSELSCQGWNQLWGLLSAAAILADLVVLQSVLSVTKSLIIHLA